MMIKILNSFLTWFVLFQGILFVIIPVQGGGGVDMDKNNQIRLEKATVGAGCFWCLEPIYQSLKGIEDVRVGYTGGEVADPTYEAVYTGNTGHAEVAQITFDPQIISFTEILEIFFFIHDPTTLNRQGADVGTQYRSAIFYHSDEQKMAAEKMIQRLTRDGIFQTPIVTEVTPLDKFYLAENYHQEYYNNNTSQPYCSIVISPKIEKFRKQFSEKLKK